jgi:hypothetical protein
VVFQVNLNLPFVHFLQKIKNPTKQVNELWDTQDVWIQKRKLEIYEKWENIIFLVDVIILSESSGEH